MKKTILFSSALLIAVAACSMQDKANKLQVCAKDIVNYCPNVSADNQLAQLLCLQEYKTRVSANCKKVIE